MGSIEGSAKVGLKSFRVFAEILKGSLNFELFPMESLKNVREVFKEPKRKGYRGAMEVSCERKSVDP